MHITLHTGFETLRAHAVDWNRLAREVPFRGWDWMECWWKHYGRDHGRATPNKELLLLAVWDDGELVGVAPWYLDHVWAEGRSIRCLGAGEACSDYLSILCERGRENLVGESLAHWLTEQQMAGTSTRVDWDVLELTGIAEGDLVGKRLLESLAMLGNDVHLRPGLSCWRIALPASWPEYVATLSKSHRKQVRRLTRRMLDAGRARLHVARDALEIERAFDLLVDLHQRRWQSRGQSGIFASRRFLAFHRALIRRLFAAGQMELLWLEVEGRPIAAEYHLLGNNRLYAYQSGIDPERLDYEPGRLAVAATVARAIELGRRSYDFLRGDEPYKAHWRAMPMPMIEARVVPRRAAARLRYGMLAATGSVKNWIKSGLELAGLK